MKQTIALTLLLALSACAPETGSNGSSPGDEFSTSETGVKIKNIEGFGGVIAESYGDSQEWWAEEELPEAGSPNVIIFLLDDVGFAQVGSFGSLIDTPNIDRLADNGLRFNNLVSQRSVQFWSVSTANKSEHCRCTPLYLERNCRRKVGIAMVSAVSGRTIGLEAALHETECQRLSTMR